MEVFEAHAKKDVPPPSSQIDEPLDVLQSVLMILWQLREGRAEVENQYARVVPWDGAARSYRRHAGSSPTLSNRSSSHENNSALRSMPYG